MSVHKRRIKTMQTLIAGSIVGSHPDHSAIQGELSEVLTTQRMPQLPRRRLLQVLHSTRAVDTTLATFLQVHGINSAKSLGRYITALTAHHNPSLRTLTSQEQQYYQQHIVDIRNHYMHKAGGFPGSDSNIISLLSEMEACLTRILNL